MNEKILLEKKISAISLGCDKNRVDLEHMLGALKNKGFTIIDDVYDAEIIIVNTCAFIAPAVKEAIDNILFAVNQKSNKCEKVIVTGCLNERYLNDIKQEIPEVDAFVRIKDNDDIIKTIYSLYNLRAVPTTVSSPTSTTWVSSVSGSRSSTWRNAGAARSARSPRAAP